MTTIVYSGPERTIYSDTLVTSTTVSTTATSKVEAAVKVDDLTRLKLKPVKGERPLAMAFAGTIMHMDDASRFVLNHIGTWNAYHMVIRESGAGYSHLAGSSMMLITNKKVYTFDFLRNRVEVETYDLDGYVCMGSGRKFAEAALLAYGATGLDALRVASICDPATGRIAMSHRITAKGVEALDPQVMATDEAGVMQIRRNAVKSKTQLKSNFAKKEGKYGCSVLGWTAVDRIVKTINDNADRTNKRHKEKLTKKREDKKAKAEKPTTAT